MDDILIFADTIEDLFQRTCKIIETLGRSGVILNAEKFQFRVNEVEFAGYKLTSENIGLSDKFFKTIKEYPELKTVKQMRGWMGLLNSLSNHTKELATLLDPLKHHICVARNTKRRR